MVRFREKVSCESFSSIIRRKNKDKSVSQKAKEN